MLLDLQPPVMVYKQYPGYKAIKKKRRKSYFFAVSAILAILIVV